METEEDPGPLKKLSKYQIEQNCSSVILSLFFKGNLHPDEYKIYGRMMMYYRKDKSEYPVFKCGVKETKIVMHFKDEISAILAIVGVEYASENLEGILSVKYPEKKVDYIAEKLKKIYKRKTENS
ncbi:MAG: hypothetical protein PHW96_04695 [Candidatus Nanoarchaeia archaeon]|nr:hypothetical protein [Candidatus Nanoarchaeia archaeon]